MDTGGRLVAGSRNRNEFVVINADDAGKHKAVEDVAGQICQICGDEIEILEEEKELFVACNECAFPICRGCYEYERREGSQACPQCKTRYKRLKGSARVEGDEEEDGDDDIDKEFSFNIFDERDTQSMYEFKLSKQLSLGSSFTPTADCSGYNISTDVPLLTYGEDVEGISSESHALVVPQYMGSGRMMPPQGSSYTFQSRPINPNKDISLYGYGSVAWKNRIDEWKRKQAENMQKAQLEDGSGGGLYADEIDNPDSLMVIIMCFSFKGLSREKDEKREDKLDCLTNPDCDIPPFLLLLEHKLLYYYHSHIHPIIG